MGREDFSSTKKNPTVYDQTRVAEQPEYHQSASEIIFSDPITRDQLNSMITRFFNEAIVIPYEAGQAQFLEELTADFHQNQTTNYGSQDSVAQNGGIDMFLRASHHQLVNVVNQWHQSINEVQAISYEQAYYAFKKLFAEWKASGGPESVSTVAVKSEFDNVISFITILTEFNYLTYSRGELDQWLQQHADSKFLTDTLVIKIKEMLDAFYATERKIQTKRGLGEIIKSWFQRN